MASAQARHLRPDTEEAGQCRGREGASVERRRRKRQGTAGLVMNLATPLSVQKLQKALHDKAKGSPSFRFYALYDKVYRKDVLAHAYQCCRANGGAAGVDGQSLEDIEENGIERWWDELTEELKSRTYRPLPVRRVYIPNRMESSGR